MENTRVYDTIGEGYNTHRTADTTILNTLTCLLQLPIPSIIADIGAGTGNYSNALANLGFTVYAVEPSRVMRNQALPHTKVIWFEGTAESIPLSNHSVDGIVVVLALHHFSSLRKATREFQRICPHGPIVVLTFDPRACAPFWFSEYFPGIWHQAFSLFPPIHELVNALTLEEQWAVDVRKFLLPKTLSDRFMAVGWNRPELYLEAHIRQSMSGFALADPTEVQQGLQQLEQDLASGVWDTRFGPVRQQKVFDAGYRFIRLKR